MPIDIVHIYRINKTNYYGVTENVNRSNSGLTYPISRDRNKFLFEIKVINNKREQIIILKWKNKFIEIKTFTNKS